MHISHDHRFVYISVPHTASWSTRNWLAANYGAEKVGEIHGATIPEGCEGYFVFSNVRDPFERVTAMWRKIHRKADRPPLERFIRSRGQEWPESFPAFVELLTSGELAGVPHAQFLPQAEILDGVDLDGVVRFSSLMEDLRSLSFISDDSPPLGHANKNAIMPEVTPETMREEYPETVEKVETWDQGASIKVHLGGSRSVLPGYVNIDKYLAFRGEVTQADALDWMKKQPAGTVENVVTRHMIEHLPRVRAEQLIFHCYRAMRSGAEIFIECPNIRYVVEKFLEEGDAWLKSIYGIQRHGGDYHLWGYTPESLQALLEEHGFRVTYVGEDGAMQRNPENGIQVRAVKP